MQWCAVGVMLPSFTSWSFGMDGVCSWGDWSFHSVCLGWMGCIAGVIGISILFTSWFIGMDEVGFCTNDTGMLDLEFRYVTLSFFLKGAMLAGF